MKGNLEWINREWEIWLKTNPGKDSNPYGAFDLRINQKQTAQLFAAHCLETLDKEIKVAEKLVWDNPEDRDSYELDDGA